MQIFEWGVVNLPNPMLFKVNYIVLSSLELHANGNMYVQYVVFAFGFMFFEIHPLCCTYKYFLSFYYQVVFHSVDLL